MLSSRESNSHFKLFSKSGIKKDILNLDNSKAFQESDISTKVIKVNSDIFVDILYEVFNRSLEVGTFPSIMKLAKVTPVYKKGSRLDKSNYRPVSILPNLSKFFERCVYRHFLMKYFQGINAVLVEGMMCNIV